MAQGSSLLLRAVTLSHKTYPLAFSCVGLSFVNIYLLLYLDLSQLLFGSNVNPTLLTSTISSLLPGTNYILVTNFSRCPTGFCPGPASVYYLHAFFCCYNFPTWPRVLFHADEAEIQFIAQTNASLTHSLERRKDYNKQENKGCLTELEL